MRPIVFAEFLMKYKLKDEKLIGIFFHGSDVKFLPVFSKFISMKLFRNPFVLKLCQKVASRNRAENEILDMSMIKINCTFSSDDR